MVYAYMVLQVALLASFASATASVALLAPITSHRMETQCMSIIEVIKLSGSVHGVENQDSHAKMGVKGQCVQPLCLPASGMPGQFLGTCLMSLCGIIVTYIVSGSPTRLTLYH